MFLRYKKLDLPTPETALPGRDVEMPVPERHAVLGTPLTGPWPAGLQVAVFGMGCFWGAERLVWRLPGVYSTSVGYAGGRTPNPTYEEVCSGLTGHAEVVQVVYDPSAISYEQLLKVFWENHDPTQGMRQGNDVGAGAEGRSRRDAPGRARPARLPTFARAGCRARWWKRCVRARPRRPHGVTRGRETSRSHG